MDILILAYKNGCKPLIFTIPLIKFSIESKKIIVDKNDCIDLSLNDSSLELYEEVLSFVNKKEKEKETEKEKEKEKEKRILNMRNIYTIITIEMI